MNVLTMTKDEIYALEHVTVREDEIFIYVTPNETYYLDIEAYPVHKKRYDTVKMLKLARYSKIEVRSIYEPSTLLADSSILNVSI